MNQFNNPPTCPEDNEIKIAKKLERLFAEIALAHDRCKSCEEISQRSQKCCGYLAMQESALRKIKDDILGPASIFSIESLNEKREHFTTFLERVDGANVDDKLKPFLRKFAEAALDAIKLLLEIAAAKSETRGKTESAVAG